MPQTELIYEAMVEDLTADRVLLEQVMNYIRDQYGITSDDLETFFIEKYPKMEDYEVDLTFSPQFTPTRADRLRYMPFLGKSALSTQQMEELVGRLEADKIESTFITPDEAARVKVPLHEVMIGRYVKLVKLDQAIDAEVHATIDQTISHECRPLAQMLSREDVWHGEPRKALLIAFLTVWQKLGNYNGEKLNFLTNFVRSYRPMGLGDLKQKLASLIASCEKDMDSTDGRGFHDEYLKSVYSESRPVASHLDDNEKGVWGHYHHMMDMSKALLDDLDRFQDIVPEMLESLNAQQQPA